MEENKLTVIVNKLEPYDELEVGLEKLVLKIECSYKDKPLVKYLYADGDDFFSIDFIYEAMKDHEEFNNLIEKHMVNDVIIYKVLVPVEIIGRNRLLVDEDRKNIEKRYNTKDLNTLSQRAMNKKVITVEKKFHSYSDLNKRKFKTIFLENFSIFGFFDGEINISENIFYKLCSFQGFIESKGDLIANNCDFIGNVDFRIKIRNKSLNNVSFENSIFRKEATFSSVKFLGNLNFSNSYFKDYVDFHECEFEKTASFYGVIFEKTPNFSQAIFKGNLNAVNTNLNFTFGDLQERIKQEYKDFNKDKKEEDQKSLDKFANDFRDSFRNFKSTLIKDNNLLDASKFHKYELYCKELELKQNWNQRGKNVESMRDVEKNIWRIRDLVDFLLLGFYRKLCDHHTDFLKVFNNLVLLITLYALFFSGFVWLHDDKLKDTREILTLFEFFDRFKSYFEIGSVICVIFGCGLFVYKLKSYEAKNNTSKKQKINFIYIINDFWNLIKSLFFAIFISCMFYILLFKFIGFFLNLGKDFGYSLFINILFISLYICLVYTKSLFFGRYVVLVLSYIGFFIILIKQPSIIHPLIGKIANEVDKGFNYPSLIVLNILYTILLALVLFSLQKTVRKNSIVPS